MNKDNFPVNINVHGNSHSKPNIPELEAMLREKLQPFVRYGIIGVNATIDKTDPNNHTTSLTTHGKTFTAEGRILSEAADNLVGIIQKDLNRRIDLRRKPQEGEFAAFVGRATSQSDIGSTRDEINRLLISTAQEAGLSPRDAYDAFISLTDTEINLASFNAAKEAVANSIVKDTGELSSKLYDNSDALITALNTAIEAQKDRVVA